MDIRTYPHPADIDADNDRLRAENVRLDGELRLRIQQLANTSRSVGDLLTANEELRAERQNLSDTNVRLFHENSALRAELDAMRQAHSVIAARMAAMGC